MKHKNKQKLTEKSENDSDSDNIVTESKKWDWFFFGVVMGMIIAFLLDSLLFQLIIK